MKAAFFCDRPETVDSVYGDGRKEAVAALTDLYPEIITSENLAQHLPHLHDLEVIFSTWGMFVPTDEQFEAMPNLKCVFYAASSVRRFAEPFLRRGIQVMTAGVANGTSVAEFTLAQILLANKGYFQNARAATSLKNRSNWPRQLYTGNFEIPRFDGWAFYLVMPIYICALASPLLAKRRPDTLFWLTIVVMLAHLCFTCAHKTLGGWHFGCRYLIDALPLAYLLCMQTRRDCAVRRLDAVLMAAGLIVNLCGTVWFYLY